jgi:hypothetical protein
MPVQGKLSQKCIIIYKKQRLFLFLKQSLLNRIKIMNRDTDSSL